MLRFLNKKLLLTAGLIACSTFAMIATANAQSAVLCVKKIGKTNVKGRDAYVSLNGKCRQPLYQAVEIGVINSLAGPIGATGATGPAGPQGQLGPLGDRGPQGVPGADGADQILDVGTCYKKSESRTYTEAGSHTEQLVVHCDDVTTQMVTEHGHTFSNLNPPEESSMVFTDESGDFFAYPIGHKVGFSFGLEGCEGSGCPTASVEITCCNTGVTSEPLSGQQ